MSLIAEDINANHSRWDTNTKDDERGEQLVDEIDTADYTIPNENEATRFPTNGRQIRPTSVWSPMTSHYHQTGQSPLSTIDGCRLTYINFKKADWTRHVEACDEYRAEAGETRTVKQVEKTLRKAVNKASGHLIPAGCIRHIKPTLASA